MARFKVVPTSDGSNTVHDSLLDVTYHSIHGALTESRHVYIEAGLSHYLSLNPQHSPVAILELGFGTGLNALLTYLSSRQSGKTVSYTALETTPLPSQIVNDLGYPQILDKASVQVFERMHNECWAADHVELSPSFQLRIVNGEIQKSVPTGRYNIAFYDAFGPGTQSELWSTNVLDKVVSQLAPKGVLVTFCAQGQFKRNLKALGMTVESIPGPPGKREMVRATKGS